MVSLTQWKLLLTVNILLYSEAIAMASLSPNDPSSFSRPEIAVIRHVSLVLNVNFEEKTLEGTATYDIDVLQNKGKVVFDVTDQTIESVQLDDDVGTHLHYVVDREVINFGKKLSIFIPPLKDDQSERGAIISIGESLDTTEEQKEKEKKITTKRSFKSKWKHKSSECGNCTSIPVLDTEPYLKDSDNESQQSTDMSQMQMKSTATEMLNKSSKRVGQKKSEYGVAMLRKFFSEETLTKLYKGETLKFYKQEMLPTQLAFMTVHPCGCYRDEINTNKIAYHNTNLVSRSLCKLPSDPSYLSCRNCSPMSSETFGSVTSEDLESQIYKVSHKVGTDSELMQELPSCHYDVCDPVGVQGFNSSRHENKNYLNNPHIARVDSPMEQIKTEQIKNLRSVRIKIQYQTSPSASALQWLEPNQTRGKKYQYLFSQCQPIHARSILPCQDTPAVKFTYDAEVTAPPNFTVLMSALREPSSNNTFKFRQPVPIPSYLLAIAVGVLESKSLGPRSTVWAEPEDLERSAYEFEDTEKYLQAAERLCGPYVWGQYDLLVLPPSFPYGGMENPCLTFVTPTLLAGDKSQADVIVHEIMHSWTGNLVTNKNFEHFWLNEGWTVFLERKVGPSLVKDPVEAKKIRDFQSILGLQELNETIIHTLGETNALTCLVPNLKEGVHPDDAFSTVPYEKGSLFLRYLEDKIGGPEKFDDFIRAYLQKYKMKSLDTDEFREFFSSYFANEEAVEDIDWGVWLYGPGMPPIIPQYDTSMTKEVKELLDRFYTPDFVPAAADVQNFSVHQKIHLLQNLIDGAALPIDKLRKIGDEYNLKSSGNTELQFRFIRLTVKSKDMDSLKDTFEFLNGQGRMKYVRPIYRDLYAWEEVRKQTIQNFLDNEKYMMYVSAYTIRKDLQLTFY